MAEQYIEQEGKTTEEAMENALQKLGASREQVKVTVLSEGKKGLLGLISKPAKVRVSLKEDPSGTPEGILKTLLNEMGIESEIESRIAEGNIYLTVKTPNAGLLIGRRGKTLNAIHFISISILKMTLTHNKKSYRE